ncbi:Uncharacterised protein [Tyzzerella nexilis]|uniref:DUF6973 domain-containing protein n=1 Tax=[Clostridium] nexile TaxID=29361 RepID=A0A6N2T022_9FIRM
MKRHVLTTLFTIATVSVGSTMMVSAAEISTPMVETVSSNTKIQSASDLDYFKGNIELENKVMEVYDYAQELKGQGYSNEQIEKSIDEYLNLSKFSDLDDYINGYLNSQEQALYDKNPAKGLLCMANGKLALGYAQDNYSSGLTDGNGDAFRHTLWNFGMVVDVGYDFAKSWSDAHEYGSSNNTSLARQMDLFNNGVGLKLGKDNPGTVLHSTFISKSKEKVRSGACRRIVNGKLVATNSSGEK